MACESALDILSRAASMVDAAEERNGSRSFLLPSRPSEEAQDLSIRPRLSPSAPTIVASSDDDAAATATMTATTVTTPIPDSRSSAAPVNPAATAATAATAAFTQTQFSPHSRAGGGVYALDSSSAAAALLTVQTADHVVVTSHAASAVAPAAARVGHYSVAAALRSSSASPSSSSSSSRFQCEAGTQTSPLSIIIENDYTVIPDYLSRSSSDTHHQETVNKAVPIPTSQSQGLLRPLPRRSSPPPSLLPLRASAVTSSTPHVPSFSSSSYSSSFSLAPFPSAPRPAIVRHFIASTPHHGGGAAATTASASNVFSAENAGDGVVSDVDVSIEEHFRRSLGRNYVSASTVANPPPPTASIPAASTVASSTEVVSSATSTLGADAARSYGIKPVVQSSTSREDKLSTSRSHGIGVHGDSIQNHGDRIHGNINNNNNNNDNNGSNGGGRSSSSSSNNSKFPPVFASSLPIPLHHPSVADSAATFAAGMLLQQLDDPVDDHFAKALGVTWLKLRNAKRHSSSSSSSSSDGQDSYGKRPRAGATLSVKTPSFPSSSSSFTSSLGGVAPSSRPDVVFQSHILRRRPAATPPSASFSTRHSSDAEASAMTQTRSASSRKIKANNGNSNNNNGSNGRTPSIPVFE